jgi:hypothetical protein
MFRCERCGSGFHTTRVLESCPRCRENDGVKTPLTFELFDLSPTESKTAAKRRAISGTARNRQRRAA